MLAKVNEAEERSKPHQKNNSYFTLKDHKEDFISTKPVRIISPSQNEIGKISKVFLDRIDIVIVDKLKLPQWPSTNATIVWFKTLLDKARCKLVKFDIILFYPSITTKILIDAIVWTRNTRK